jgi:hypothetical protein
MKNRHDSKLRYPAERVFAFDAIEKNFRGKSEKHLVISRRRKNLPKT